MTQLQKENIDLKVKVKEIRKKYKAKLDSEISHILSKYIIWGIGGAGLFGYVAGRFGH